LKRDLEGGENMTRFLHTLSGFALGLVFGAGLGLLFVPHSGTETRQLIQSRMEAIAEEGRQAAAARQHELAVRFEDLKKSTPVG
jgi:gas vesicle protein